MSRFELTDGEFANLFVKYPLVRKAENGLPTCPYCGNAFSDNNLEVYGFQTEYGTEGTSYEIDCDVCRKPIWHGGSWSCDPDKEDVLEDLDEELRYFEGDWVRKSQKAAY